MVFSFSVHLYPEGTRSNETVVNVQSVRVVKKEKEKAVNGKKTGHMARASLRENKMINSRNVKISIAIKGFLSDLHTLM